MLMLKYYSILYLQPPITCLLYFDFNSTSSVIGSSPSRRALASHSILIRLQVRTATTLPWHHMFLVLPSGSTYEYRISISASALIKSSSTSGRAGCRRSCLSITPSSSIWFCIATASSIGTASAASSKYWQNSQLIAYRSHTVLFAKKLYYWFINNE